MGTSPASKAAGRLGTTAGLANRGAIGWFSRAYSEAALQVLKTAWKEALWASLFPGDCHRLPGLGVRGTPVAAGTDSRAGGPSQHLPAGFTLAVGTPSSGVGVPAAVATLRDQREGGRVRSRQFPQTVPGRPSFSGRVVTRCGLKPFLLFMVSWRPRAGGQPTARRFPRAGISGVCPQVGGSCPKV